MTARIDSTGWYLSDKGDFTTGTESTASHSGEGCVFLQSVVPRPKTFGFLSKSVNADAFVGKRIKMSAWVKTNLPDGASAQLWLRVDGDWEKRPDCFDNMYDSRIKGVTEWALYEVCVAVPIDSKQLAFGILLNGTGQIWLDDTTLDTAQPDEKLAGRTRRQKPGKALQEMTAEDNAAGLTFRE